MLYISPATTMYIPYNTMPPTNEYTKLSKNSNSLQNFKNNEEAVMITMNIIKSILEYK